MIVNIQRQENLRKFVEQEVFVCQSILVDAELRKEFFSWDDVINLYRRFDGQLLSPKVCYSCKLETTCLDSETGECESCFVGNQEPQEIYEWLVVSDWLEIKLKLAGEPILSNEYGSWWGRCCTGQAIYMDGVIQKAYDETMR